MPKGNQSNMISLVECYAEVVEQMKALEERKALLREELLATGQAMITGIDHRVRITERESRRLSRPLLEAKFGKTAVDACCTVSSSNFVFVDRINR